MFWGERTYEDVPILLAENNIAVTIKKNPNYHYLLKKNIHRLHTDSSQYSGMRHYPYRCN